ncbi:MAG: hypothetical protein JSW73_05705 [Candidatus Woesearchaeota archaeon]|nr:MAG: hypothetical protein JSW73_05705 [Candidatus Woesearchaeota archaeon]
MAKKKKNLSKTGGVIVIILFIGSTLAIGLRSLSDDSPEIIEGKEKIEFEGYTFYYDPIENSYSIFAKIEDNRIEYITDVKDATTRFAFRGDPRNISSINLDEDVVDIILNSNKIYLAYNPNEENLSKIAIAGIEIVRLTGNVFRIPSVEAYTEDADPVDPNVPLKTCEDATELTPIIFLEITDTTEIISEGNCIYVRGKNADELIEASDKLGMNLVGVKI